jgi:hypothetical protein
MNVYKRNHAIYSQIGTLVRRDSALAIILSHIAHDSTVYLITPAGMGMVNEFANDLLLLLVMLG